MHNTSEKTFLGIQKLKICMTCLFHYTPVLDLCEAHIANQQYSPFTMADNPFSSALPPSLPPTIPPLNNNINKVPKQEKTSKYIYELTDLLQSLTSITHLPPQDHCCPPVTIPSYPCLLQHIHTVMLAMLFPIQKGQLLLRKKCSIPPMDNTALILKVLSPQAQRLWR